MIEIEEPGQPISLFADIAVGLGESKNLDLVAVHSLTIRRDELREHSARLGAPICGSSHSTAMGFAFETRIGSDGQFTLDHLPPGEYGLKVGHDAYWDTDRPGRWFWPTTTRPTAGPPIHGPLPLARNRRRRSDDRQCATGTCHAIENARPRAVSFNSSFQLEKRPCGISRHTARSTASPTYVNCTLHSPLQGNFQVGLISS